MVLSDTLRIIGASELCNFKINYKGEIIKRLFKVEPSEYIDKIFSETINLGMELDIKGLLKDFISGASQEDELRSLWMNELIEASKPLPESEKEKEPEPEGEDPIKTKERARLVFLVLNKTLDGFEEKYDRFFANKTPSRKEIIEISKETELTDITKNLVNKMVSTSMKAKKELSVNDLETKPQKLYNELTELMKGEKDEKEIK